MPCWAVTTTCERIACPGFTVVDDGRRPGGLGSKPFDGEGLPTRRNVLILATLGAAVLEGYEHHKAWGAFLDYDDLILKTRDLLQTQGMTGWVLFKLDGGLDHVLIDEAQDTNPEQWQVIEALSEEFFAGEGARDRTRTVFAVGDAKQSIFGFQRADPAAFAASLCDHPVGTLITVERSFGPDGIVERFRTVDRRTDGEHAKIWEIVADEGPDG